MTDVIEASASSELPQSKYVFNQYYLDFLKKVKDHAKRQKETSRTARNVLRSIKKYYMAFNKLSSEHFDFFHEHCYEAWKQYNVLPIATAVTFFEEANRSNDIIFKDITLADVYEIMKDESFVIHQYFALFGILCDPDVNPSVLLELMKQFKMDDELKMKLGALPDGTLKSSLTHLLDVYAAINKKSAGSFAGGVFEDLEETTLGKLAKEIMDEINLDDLQKNISPNMLQSDNIMDMFTKSDGGIAQIISSVSQKMVSKMASGEIKQDDLLKDAINFATKLPGMMPSGMAGNMANLGKMGEMLGSLSGMAGGGGGAGGAGGFDFSAMASMMSGMMGGGGAQQTAKSMNHPARAGMAKHRMNSEMKRQKTTERLRRHLDGKKKNVESQLEEPSTSSHE